MAEKIFDRYSFDLIYARPKQTLKDWEQELNQALEYTRDHLSLYQLTIERGTPFYIQHARGEFQCPEQDLAADFYELTNEKLSAHDLPAYEVSNHAKKGEESTHNITYWRYNDYAGIGPGAHGRLTIEGKKIATRTHRAPDEWLNRVRDQGHGFHAFEPLSVTETVYELVMMGLRTYEGVSLRYLEEILKRPWQSHIPQKKLDPLIEEKLLYCDEARLYPTPKGMQRLNRVVPYLLTVPAESVAS